LCYINQHKDYSRLYEDVNTGRLRLEIENSMKNTQYSSDKPRGKNQARDHPGDQVEWQSTDRLLANKLTRWVERLESAGRKAMYDHSLLAEKLVQAKREELLREAAKARLAAQAGGGGTLLKKYKPLAGRALTLLGRRLVTWGERLQDRYSPAEAPLFRLE
jgi:hypothetical protein